MWFGHTSFRLERFYKLNAFIIIMLHLSLKIVNDKFVGGFEPEFERHKE